MEEQSIVDFGKLWSELTAYDVYSPLVFNSGLFLILFLCFIMLYRLVQGHRTTKLVTVILFSLYFYYKSTGWYCMLLLFTCVADYGLGLWMGQAARRRTRKWIVAINVVVNISILCFFKYFGLLAEGLATFTSTRIDAAAIILPMGLSFFTFRSISYIVDLYRRKLSPCTNFLDYCFYLTFFPTLLMGPVTRAKDFLPQVKADPEVTKAMVSEGLFLIMAGLVKKVVVADYIGGNFVERIFDNPALYSGFENLVGVYGFTIWLYCDFSGYTDMALGLALLLGYRLPNNFISPFKSQSPSEFWHRWHISLSVWLRDYVYIPLGGNRCPKWRRNLNLFITMVVGGIWHGATFMFAIWGALHGALLIAHKWLKGVLPKLPPHKKGQWWRVALNVFVTFNLVAIIFMFFKAKSLRHVGDMVHQVFNEFRIHVAPEFIYAYILVVGAMILGFFLHFTPASWQQKLKRWWDSTPIFVQAIVLAVVIFIIIQVRQSDIVPFIYLQY